MNGIIKVRVGESLVKNWGAIRQRAILPGGPNIGDPSRARGADTSPLTELVALRGNQIQLPEMIALSPKLSIMKTEISVGLFKQVMEGYEITGDNKDNLIARLADPKATGNALNYVSLLDAREFAKRLSEQISRNFRVQTEEEWDMGRRQLSGNNWTWTETPYSRTTFVLRHLGSGSRGSVDPEFRYYNFAVRLVEDLK